MDSQLFLITLIGFGIFIVILFSFDIYYLTKKTKKDRNAMSLMFSEEFLSGLEKMTNQEIKKTISNTNERISNKITESYEKQINLISQEAENKMTGWNEEIKKNILKFSDACSLSEELIIKQTEKIKEELTKNLDQKINKIYQKATESISQKINETETEINNYKKEKIKEIDQKIYKIMEGVAKKTIGKTIDLSVHEELVLEALEKAKKENFL